MIIVLEVGLFFIVITTIVTQFILPFFRGTPYFPIFLRETTLLKKLEVEKQNSVEIALEQDIKQLKEVNKKNLESLADPKEETDSRE